jgi:acetolactate synthase-1/2/3 large subunit
MPPESGDWTRPLVPRPAPVPTPTDETVARAARLVSAAARPLLLAGNGVIRQGAAGELRRFAQRLGIPVVATFMGKGAIDDRDGRSLMAVGLQARDHVLTAFERADLVVCVGYDPVEYAPARWNADRTARILAIDTLPVEVDASYQPELELVGDIRGSLAGILAALGDRAALPEDAAIRGIREKVLADLLVNEADDGWPVKPQKAIADLRRALAPEDLVICDVGAHKVWVARLYQAYEPNTVIISNGFAAMGISVPGAIAASLVHPDRKVVALTGDGAFLMNSQELETAKRVGARITVVVWRDDGYGLIDWKQRTEFGRPFGVGFGNPDLVAYARSFGIPGFRPDSAADLYPTLMRALAVDGPSLVDVPIDYAENVRLTERLALLDG